MRRLNTDNTRIPPGIRWTFSNLTAPRSDIGIVTVVIDTYGFVCVVVHAYDDGSGFAGGSMEFTLQLLLRMSLACAYGG